MSRFEALPTTDKIFFVSIETVRSRYTPSAFLERRNGVYWTTLNLARTLGVPRDTKRVAQIIVPILA